MSCESTFGIDIVDTGRFAELIKRFGSGLEDQLYTPSERILCIGNVKRKAAYFAVKEAVAKALGVGIDYISHEGVSLLDIEVCETAGSPICIKLSGKARCLAVAKKLQKWTASYSYSLELAVAFAAAEPA